MRQTIGNGNSMAVTVILEKRHVEQLDRIAKRTDRSRAWVVRKIIGDVVEADARGQEQLKEAS